MKPIRFAPFKIFLLLLNLSLLVSAIVSSAVVTPKSSASVTRGPYLQIGTANSIRVRWRTNIQTDSKVQFGPDPSQLTSSRSDSTLTTEHKITVNGLSSGTRYYYAVGTTQQRLYGGNNSTFFETSPSSSSVVPAHIWVIGDGGYSSAAAVRDAYYAYNGSNYTDLWLMLGDNAYESGTDSEYQNVVFNFYRSLLRQTPVWPTFGNHEDVSSDSDTQTGPYYDIFTLPKNAEAGGASSGTEAYYSFDYSNIHFICLDSSGSDRSSNGAMLTWLQNDLNSTNKEWTIAFWHHAPYTKGQHDSDISPAQIEMRENALPILEGAGVDLVLAGHSHDYERTFFLDSHYGLSTTFSGAVTKDGGDGREDGRGAYIKHTTSPEPHSGTVYVVAGSSSTTTQNGSLNHPAMYKSLRISGSLVLDIDHDRLEAKFIDTNQVVKDHFTILKGIVRANKPTAPSNLDAVYTDDQVELSWTDNSGNEDAYKIERSLDGTSYSVRVIVGANVTSYVDTPLPELGPAYYRVRAWNTAGYSGYSNVKSANWTGIITQPGSLYAVYRTHQ